jgi:hypothetical protein
MANNGSFRTLLSAALRELHTVPDDSREVYRILVKTTLSYRDMLREEKGKVLTVEDTRITLKMLRETLKTGILPKKEEKTRLDLLKLWLDALKPFL